LASGGTERAKPGRNAPRERERLRARSKPKAGRDWIILIIAHARESGDPEPKDWMPAFAGMSGYGSGEVK